MKFTLILIALLVLGFVLPQIFVSDLDAFYSAYGFSGNNFVEHPYVIITSIFLHASIVHLLSNILVLFFFGAAVESELGRLRFLEIFFAGAFAGFLVSFFFYPPSVLGIGASAGIFALIGAGMLVRPLDLSYYPLVLPIPLAFFGLAYALYNAYAFVLNLDPNVAYVGHFGGLAVGLIFGFKKTGFRRGAKIILVTLAIMTLIPVILFLLTK